MNVKNMLRIASAVLAGSLLSGCCCNNRWAADAPRDELIAVPAPGPVKIDGVLDEKEWAGSPVFPMHDIHREPVADPPPKLAAVVQDPFESGTVRFMYDSNYLYVGAKLQDSDIMQYGEKDQTMLFLTGDALEIFIKPERSPEYWECYAAPNGKRTTLCFETRWLPFNSEKSFLQKDFHTAVTLQGTLNDRRDKDQGWTVEAAIPVKMLEKTGIRFVPGEIWTVLIARYNYNYGAKPGGFRLSSCPELPRGNFHLTEYYARLVLKTSAGHTSEK